MVSKIKIITAIAVLVVASSAGILLSSQEAAQKEETSLFTYPLSVGNETYVVTVEANWNTENAPTVSLDNSSDRHAIELYFLGGTKKTLTYNISFPAELIGGNISLVWKYYLQNPNRYTLSSNGTFNSLGLTFDYDPHFSGIGYFEILGTEGALLDE